MDRARAGNKFHVGIICSLLIFTIVPIYLELKNRRGLLPIMTLDPEYNYPEIKIINLRIEVSPQYGIQKIFIENKTIIILNLVKIHETIVFNGTEGICAIIQKLNSVGSDYKVVS